ncbi:tRNA pseudouridine(38-40) synthase TruA [soil metagenome]
MHALGQVVSCSEAPDEADLDGLTRSLNALLGPSIAVTRCSPAHPDFHARFSARSRTYVYAVLQTRVPDPFLARTALHHPGPLDAAAMTEAAGHLVGRHDWRSFGRLPEPQSSAERTLFELRCAPDGRLLRITARADGFIQQMVRSIVGTLLTVGEGRRSPDELPSLLAAADRAAAGPVAPAHGLCLVAVEYDQGWSVPLGGESG